MCFNSITILAHALELCTTYGFEHCWLLPFPCFVNDDRLKMISYEVPTETTNILKNHTGAESPRNNLAGCISSQQHHRPPSFPVCLCICCSLRGRCSYEERQQADRATSTLHSPYDYLSIYLTATIARPPPTPSKHHHLSLQQSFVWASSTLVSRQLGWITRGWRPTACSQDVQTARDCKRPLNSQRNGCLLW